MLYMVYHVLFYISLNVRSLKICRRAFKNIDK